MKTINVTSDDIAKGKRGSACSCPIALAIKRATNQACHVGVRWYSFERDLTDMPLPRKAGEFVIAFDQKQPVEPFSFELDI